MMIAMMRVRSTGMPAMSATAMWCPTARMSCPSLVRLNQITNRHSTAMTRYVAMGRPKGPRRRERRLSSDWRTLSRFSVLRMPYPRDRRIAGERMGMMTPMRYRTTNW